MSEKVASIKIRRGIDPDESIPFECEDGTFYLDDETVRKCKYVSQPDDDEFVWVVHPDYGMGQLLPHDLDFVMKGETDD